MNWAAILQLALPLVEQELPFFIHSKKGVAILNATEEVANPLINAAVSATLPSATAAGATETVAQAQGH